MTLAVNTQATKKFIVTMKRVSKISHEYEVIHLLRIRVSDSNMFIETWSRYWKVGNRAPFWILRPYKLLISCYNMLTSCENVLSRYQKLQSNQNNRQHPVYGKNKFFLERGKRIHDQGLELWKGFYLCVMMLVYFIINSVILNFSSLRPTLRRLILNIDMSTAVMFVFI